MQKDTIHKTAHVIWWPSSAIVVVLGFECLYLALSGVFVEAVGLTWVELIIFPSESMRTMATPESIEMS